MAASTQNVAACDPPARRQRTNSNCKWYVALFVMLFAVLVGVMLVRDMRASPQSAKNDSLSAFLSSLYVTKRLEEDSNRTSTPTHNISTIVAKDIEKSPTTNMTAHQRVIVVGSGLAGQSAAIEAANCGAQVILLEKESKLGGNSAKATSGINGWGTPAQQEQGIEDCGKYFERDTYRSGRGGNCDPGLVRMLSVKSADAIRWLSNFGVPLTVLSQLGGASRKRCHRAPDKSDGTPVPIGFVTVRSLENHIRSQLGTQVQIETDARLTRIVHKDITLPSGQTVKMVTGVEYEKTITAPAQPDDQNTTHKEPSKHVQTIQMPADAVILATGGFSNDRTSRSLLQEFAPQLASFPTTNGPWATGDGVKMARELGVELVDMDKVQLHPTGLIDPKDPANRTKYLGPEALRGSGGVLINKSGERFVNELDLRSVVSQAIIAQNNEYPGSNGSKFAYCVLNENAVSLFGKNALGFYWKRLGLFEKVNDVKELAKLIGCSEETLTNTLTQYEKVSREGLHACPNTGKNVFPCVLGPQGPFYVAFVTPSIHYTMGGCLISPSAQILSHEESPFGGHLPILGLFGAGEVTGGVHGKNRLGGNSLLECVVFGRIAGRRAAAEVGPDRTLFDANKQDATKHWVRVTVEQIVFEGDPEFVDAESARQIIFALPSIHHVSGLALLQSVLIRGSYQGQRRSVRLLPSSPPNTLGSIAIYLPRKENEDLCWLYELQPGDVVEIHAGAQELDVSAVKGQHAVVDPYNILHDVKKLFIVATAPEGVPAVLQLLQAATQKPLRDQLTNVHLLYAARNVSELSYRKLVQGCEETNASYMTCKFIVDVPPLKWTGDVGVIDEEVLLSVLPPMNAELKDSEEVKQTAIVVAIAPPKVGAVQSYLIDKNYTNNAKVYYLSL